MTEALTAGLAASFIVSDGVVKAVGVWLLLLGVSEWWMPFVVGLLFTMPLLGFTWMLAQIPPPGPADVVQRSRRAPMAGADRRRFFRNYALGLTLLVLVYLLMTILRSIRSDFAVEIWQGLGFRDEPAIFAWSELAVMLGVVLINGAAILIRDNRRAFFTALATSLAGFLLVILALIGLAQHQLSGFLFMVLLGLGLYIPYVAVHTTIFERLIALLRDRGNIGYLMYLADAFGYLGYVGVMVAKNFLWGGMAKSTFLDLVIGVAWVTAVCSIVLLGGCWWYFARRTAPSGEIVA